MYRSAKISVIFSILFFGSARYTLAWNKAGHMVSGAVAYFVLKEEHPETLAKALAMLKQHPDYDQMWKVKLNAVREEDRDLYLFMLAARWPDDLKSRTHEFDHVHYVNFTIRKGMVENEATGDPIGDGNLMKAFPKRLDRLRDRTATPADRAQAMCWVFHLIGDCHQPLHVGAFVGQQWPNGDEGGNKFLVRVTENNHPTKLHQLWDGMVLGTERFRSVSNEAQSLLTRPTFHRSNLTELADTSFEDWVKKESFRLAKQVAYWNADLDGSSDPQDDDIPVLPDDYLKVAKPVAERRITLAGYRVADTLVHSLN